MTNTFMRHLITIVESEGKPMVIRLGKSAYKAEQDAFMADFQAATSDHPLDHRARLLKNAVITLYPFGNNIHISDIRALRPASGGGKEALTLICQLADKHGLKLDLTAKTYLDSSPLSTSELQQWYARYGFTTVEDHEEEIYGNDEDGYDMIRMPR